MDARRPLGRGLARALLGALIGITSVGFSVPAASAAPESETVTLTIQCAEGRAGEWPSRWSRQNLTAGRDRGRGWSYTWYCLTFPNRQGKEEHHILVDFEQWGGSTINLAVVSPENARLWWAGTPGSRP